MIVAFDMDGPIADLHTEWYRRYNRDYNDDLSLDRVVTWDLHNYVKPECGKKIYDYLRDPDLYANVKPVEGALEHMKWLRENGHEVIVVTAGVSGNLDQKLDWLKNNGFSAAGERSMGGVIFAYDKKYIRAQMLIDDGPHNIQAFGGTGVVWDAPYNKGVGRYRIHNWNEFGALWEKLYG